MLVHGRTKPRRNLRDRLDYRGARMFAALPPRLQVRLAGGAPVRVDGQQLHPELQLLLRMRDRMGARPYAEMTPEQARRQSRREGLAMAGPAEPVGAVHDLQLPGGLAARHYVPDEPGGPHPLLVYLHGGGFVIGDLDVYEQPCRILCRHAGVHVLSVAYRLAPEHRFPDALDDAETALAWAQEHASELGADPGHVAIGGDSAGGNLAAVASRECPRRPCAQLLIYPAADMEEEYPSLSLFGEGFFLTRADREWFHHHYLGDEPADDPRAVRLKDARLDGLPPALVVTAAFDPLRDEGEAYAAALREAGNVVLLRRFPGLIHGFVNMTGVSPASRAALIETAGALRVLARQGGSE
jgi:acetyl esterase